MDGNNNYAKQLFKERMRIRNDVSKFLKPQGLELTKLQIVDEGYVVDAVPVDFKNEGVSFGELCERVDAIDFEHYAIVDITFSLDVVNMVLVPTNKDTMNDFIWNYIMCYFPFDSELVALSFAISVLERMIEPLDETVKAEYENLITIIIQ